MKNLFTAIRRNSDLRPDRPDRRLTTNRPVLTRTFVETGDKRCPIAGIWSCISNIHTADDEPEITLPAIGSLLSWRAFLPLCHIETLH
jgi:hypothetical protein